ncbi:hypothetical protein COU59_03400 [Candidatus Pacearchaeota archaeon CG10_big_fil_rev_8_21_14_0_10_34_12]|nr:MAG: hypothetical protein COU59_03400 [Candidatus Pacearchaeota archaeon CG10_big_fil_rev_8_21_14_0_10_34_12]
MNNKIILWVLVGLVVLGLAVSVFFPNMIYAIKDFGKSSGISGNSENSDEDICSPPEGTSLEDWIEHMGHHPNIYKECLS